MRMRVCVFMIGKGDKFPHRLHPKQTNAGVSGVCVCVCSDSFCWFINTSPEAFKSVNNFLVISEDDKQGTHMSAVIILIKSVTKNFHILCVCVCVH